MYYHSKKIYGTYLYQGCISFEASNSNFKLLCGSKNAGFCMWVQKGLRSKMGLIKELGEQWHADARLLCALNIFTC